MNIDIYTKIENIHQDEMIINKNKDRFWIHICLAFKKIFPILLET